ncbi:TOMM precursor leader peptide-binding protein [Cryobacterium arcticum]|nr:TOMM precursor leader peptide-binding protein [Cryobacterium arcticum]
MIVRLDPRYPLVWRSPDTIQLGIDRPLAIVPGVTAPLEGVIDALRAGVPWSGALMLGREAGASDAATTALLQALAPALLDTDARPAAAGPAEAEPAAEARAPATHRPVAVVHVDGAGPTARRIRQLLADLGLTVLQPGQAGPDPSLAVIVDHFVLSPERHNRWLRRDLPHLPVLFSDTEARIGPLVEPGAGPCLTCLELDRVDADPAWPAIATQLLHRTAPTETTRVGIEVAATVAAIVHDRVFAASNEFAATSIAIDAESLSVRRRAHRPHERCGCRFLPENVIVLAGNAAGFRPRTS